MPETRILFQPFITVTVTEGSVSGVEVDWFDCQQNAFQGDTEIDPDEHPDGAKAREFLDRPDVQAAVEAALKSAMPTDTTTQVAATPMNRQDMADYLNKRDNR